MFLPPIPTAPFPARTENERESTEQRQRERVRRFSAMRARSATATWRAVMFGKHLQHQSALIEAMKAANFPETTIERTENCSRHTWVFEHTETLELQLRHYTCHSRFCLLCQRNYIRAIRIAAMRAVPATTRRLSLLTLTQRSLPGWPLADALRTIVKTFVRLRRSPAWTRRVTGGLYVLEVTRGELGNWHAHLHAVIDTTWWPLEELTDLWSKLIGYPSHPHIKVLEGDRDAGINTYLSKYMSKPFDDSLYENHEALTAFVAACRGKRMLQAFGTWCPSNLTRKAAKEIARTESPDNWKLVGELHDLLEEAEGGSIRAARYLERLGFTEIQLRQGAHSEIDDFWKTRAPPEPPTDNLFTQVA